MVLLCRSPMCSTSARSAILIATTSRALILPTTGGREMVERNAETGGRPPVDYSRRPLFCTGRQSRRQPGQPVLGIRTTRKYHRTSAFDLLVSGQFEQ